MKMKNRRSGTELESEMEAENEERRGKAGKDKIWRYQPPPPLKKKKKE